MPSAIKNFTEKRLKEVFLKEYFEEELAQAEYGNMIFTQSAAGTKITLKVGRVGYAIGKKGRTIIKLSADVKKLLGSNKVQIEVEELDEPELNPMIMAQRLASALERGRHFRRTAYGTLRRIMSKKALGVEIIVAGKITSQRARVEKFRDGFIAKTGEPKSKFVMRGHARARIKRGILGVTVLIMKPDAVLPDHIEIIAEPTHTSKEIGISEMLDADEMATLAQVELDTDDNSGDLKELENLEELTGDSKIPKEAMDALEEEGEDLEIEEEDEDEK